MIKLDFDNRTYWQFCLGNQFQAAQTFWDEEGIKFLYVQDHGESKSELMKRWLTSEKDYMVPGSGSFSSEWGNQCIARRLQVKDDLRMEEIRSKRQGQAKKTKHSDPANDAAAKRREEMAGAAEKRAKNGQHDGTDHKKSKEYLEWKDFIIAAWPNENDDATSAAAQEDGADEEQPHAAEEEKKVSAMNSFSSFILTTTYTTIFSLFQLKADAAADTGTDANAGDTDATGNTFVNVSKRVHDIENRSAAKTNSGTAKTDKNSNAAKSVPPQVVPDDDDEESDGKETFVFGSKKNVEDHRSKVLLTLPESLQFAFGKENLNLLGLALSAMTADEQVYHMNKCIECGLWQGDESEPPSGVVRGLWKGEVSKPPSSPAIRRTRMNDPKTKDMEDMLTFSREQRINKEEDARRRRKEVISKKRAKNASNEVKENLAGEKEAKEKLGRTRSETRFEEELRTKAGEKNNRTVVEELD